MYLYIRLLGYFDAKGMGGMSIIKHPAVTFEAHTLDSVFGACFNNVLEVCDGIST